MGKIEQLSCDLCFKENPGYLCTDVYGGRLKFPKLPEPDGLRKLGEPVQFPDQWVQDCEEYQKKKS